MVRASLGASLDAVAGDARNALAAKITHIGTK